MNPKIMIGTFAVALQVFAPLSTSIAAGNLTQIQICTAFPHPIVFSMAYPSTNGGSGDWISRGWDRLETGYCSYFDNALHVPIFYFRAQSLPYVEKGRRVQETWGSAANSKSFCTAKSFTARYNYWAADSKAACGRSDSFVPFLIFSGSNQTSTDVDAAYTLTFGGDGTTVTTYNPVKPNAPAAK